MSDNQPLWFHWQAPLPDRRWSRRYHRDGCQHTTKIALDRRVYVDDPPVGERCESCQAAGPPPKPPAYPGHPPELWCATHERVYRTSTRRCPLSGCETVDVRPLSNRRIILPRLPAVVLAQLETLVDAHGFSGLGPYLAWRIGVDAHMLVHGLTPGEELYDPEGYTGPLKQPE